MLKRQPPSVKTKLPDQSEKFSEWRENAEDTTELLNRYRCVSFNGLSLLNRHGDFDV